MNNTVNSKNIAILGANGHIAKNLIYYFLKNSNHSLFLYSRSPTQVQEFIIPFNSNSEIYYGDYANFSSAKYDVIINCIGLFNTSNSTVSEFDKISIIEKYDNLVINYLMNNPSSMYINFSSGIVHGESFPQPSDDDSITKIKLNTINANSSYFVSKISSEMKHRVLTSLNIVDIRIFSFFSRFIDLSSNFFISKLISSINTTVDFLTTTNNFYRDYVHPDDLFQLVTLCMVQSKLNNAFDIYSKSPISKFDILEEFSKYYDFQYSSTDNLKFEKSIGDKTKYYSIDRSANDLGYSPKFSSIESLLTESKFLLK
jgi:nucleoside-diphosphate-sugar epimerase